MSNAKTQMSKLKLDWKFFLFLAVFTSSIFLRLFHFSDWLYFKRDEARDAFVILRAYLHGPGWLPLLGPNATGASFFSGPIYYYFQYLAALLFRGPRPEVLAYPDLFFSLLTPALLYFFLKKYFSRDWSLALAALFAVNFFAIEYSRFAWNPNALPFFNLLFFLALINIFDAKAKHPLAWSAAGGAAFAIATQLHVISQAALPVITIAFLVYKRRDLKRCLNWKKIAVFVSVVVLLYVPIIVNEIAKHGRNTEGLLSAANKEPYFVSPGSNVLADLLFVGQHWFLSLTGYVSAEKEFLPAIAAWLIFILPAIYLIVSFSRKEDDERRKNFLFVVLIWLAGYLFLFFPVAMHLQPRFFLPVEVVPVVFAGLTARYLWDRKKIVFRIFAVAALGVFFLGNLAGALLWFREIKAAQAGPARSGRTIILKEKDGVVLWHLEKAADYMESACGRPPIYYYANAEYGTPIRYMLAMRGLDSLDIEAYRPDRPGCVFMIDPSPTGRVNIGEKEKNNLNFLDIKSFGVMKVYKAEFKENAGLDIFTKVQKEKRVQYLYWKDIHF